MSQADLDSLLTPQFTLAVNFDPLKDVIKDILGRLTKQEIDMEKLKADNNELRDSLAKANAANEAGTADLEELKNQLEGLQSSQHAIAEQAANAQEAAAEAGDAEGVQGELDDLKNQLEDLRQQIAQLGAGSPGTDGNDGEGNSGQDLQSQLQQLRRQMQGAPSADDLDQRLRDLEKSIMDKTMHMLEGVTGGSGTDGADGGGSPSNAGLVLKVARLEGDMNDANARQDKFDDELRALRNANGGQDGAPGMGGDQGDLAARLSRLEHTVNVEVDKLWRALNEKQMWRQGQGMGASTRGENSVAPSNFTSAAPTARDEIVVLGDGDASGARDSRSSSTSTPAGPAGPAAPAGKAGADGHDGRDSRKGSASVPSMARAGSERSGLGSHGGGVEAHRSIDGMSVVSMEDMADIYGQLADLRNKLAAQGRLLNGSGDGGIMGSGAITNALEDLESKVTQVTIQLGDKVDRADVQHLFNGSVASDAPYRSSTPHEAMDGGASHRPPLSARSHTRSVTAGRESPIARPRTSQPPARSTGGTAASRGELAVDTAGSQAEQDQDKAMMAAVTTPQNASGVDTEMDPSLKQIYAILAQKADRADLRSFFESLRSLRASVHALEGDLASSVKSLRNEAAEFRVELTAKASARRVDELYKMLKKLRDGANGGHMILEGDEDEGTAGDKSARGRPGAAGHSSSANEGRDGRDGGGGDGSGGRGSNGPAGAAAGAGPALSKDAQRLLMAGAKAAAICAGVPADQLNSTKDVGKLASIVEQALGSCEAKADTRLVASLQRQLDDLRQALKRLAAAQASSGSGGVGEGELSAGGEVDGNMLRNIVDALRNKADRAEVQQKAEKDALQKKASKADVVKLSKIVKQLLFVVTGSGQLKGIGEHAVIATKPLQSWKCLSCEQPLQRLSDGAGQHLPAGQLPPSAHSIRAHRIYGGGASPPRTREGTRTRPGTRGYRVGTANSQEARRPGSASATTPAHAWDDERQNGGVSPTVLNMEQEDDDGMDGGLPDISTPVNRAAAVSRGGQESKDEGFPTVET